MKKKALTYNGIIVDLHDLGTGIYPDSFPKFYPMEIEDEQIKNSIHLKYVPKINLETFICNLGRCKIECFELRHCS